MSSFKDNNDKWLDDLLEKAIGGKKMEPDFERWQQSHPEAVEMLTSRANRQTSTSTHPLSIWRIIMKSSVTKLAAAAVIIIGVVLSTTIWNKSIPTASAAQQVLAEAVKAVANLRSVYIKAQMRTVAHDNFELIGLDYDFVPVEMWKEFDGTSPGKWRFEKPERVAVMDGQSTTMLMKNKYACKAGTGAGFVQWLKPLLDVDKVLDSELRKAQSKGSELLLTHEQAADGNDKLVVTVDASAQGDFTNDWCKNTTIIESDNQRVYTFDAQTKFLESLKVYVHAKDNDVLVFEITDIKYNIDINPTLFTLKLPDDVIWLEEPKVLEDKYQQMSPKEVAAAFFQACAEENWDEVLKFWNATTVDQRIKNYLGGLEIISIGEPFKSGLYPGWFVPYEVKFKSGRIKKMNLAVRNDNPAKRYVVDGGF